MSLPRVAVVFRTYFWDDFAFRSAVRVWNMCAGLDFYVEVNETETGPVDVGPFRKLVATTAGFEALGLPCAAPEGAAPLWWNCDYGLYGAALAMPDYDYYFLIEYDVAVNLQLGPLIGRIVAAGRECVTCFDDRPIAPGWAFSGSCAGLPYVSKVWGPLCMMFASRRASLHLLSERQRLARLRAGGRMPEWPISEGFFCSALADAKFSTGALRQFTELPSFGTEAIFLEDEALARAGGFAHAVLDTGRFWKKFVERSFGVLMGGGHYDRLRQIRGLLRARGRTDHQGWRIAEDSGNLAVDRPARQSSCSRWSRKGVPRIEPAVLDARGGNCGVRTGRYCFHTEFEAAPWWAVDLERLCGVEEIRIFNSAHCPERARRLLLEVSSDGTQWREVHRKTDDRLFGGIADPLICRLPEAVPARHVRVSLGEPGILHLDEIEVYGGSTPMRA